MKFLRRKLISFFALFAGMFMYLDAGYAYGVKKFSLEEKVKRSHIVIVGVVKTPPDLICPEGYRCADVVVERVLKGSPGKKISIVFDGPVAERHSVCCKENLHYLFFLRRGNDGLFDSVNGPYGIYELPNETSAQ
jgi:hypothetical protein